MSDEPQTIGEAPDAVGGDKRKIAFPVRDHDVVDQVADRVDNSIEIP